MGLNDLSTRAVVLLVDEIESIAGIGHTASATSVDKAAAALVNLANLYDVPIIVSGVSWGAPPKLTPALREALGERLRSTFARRPTHSTTPPFSARSRSQVARRF